MNSREIGSIGEGVACTFLVKRGFSIVERNYLRKWGEIDIVSEKDGKLHFVEVKSLIVQSLASVNSISSSSWKPEDNVHSGKRLRLRRVISTYLVDKKVDPDAEFSIDVISVRIDMGRRVGRVLLIDNIIL